MVVITGRETAVGLCLEGVKKISLELDLKDMKLVRRQSLVQLT